MDPISFDAFRKMLQGAAALVRANHETLSKLDSCGGDGDHGTTMARAMDKLEEAAEAAEPTFEALLNDVGWAIMGVDGGATGPLFGTFFMSMAGAVSGQDALDASGLATAFEAGLGGLRQQTKAQPGDKTLIDALVPAVHALREAAEDGADAARALECAAEGALRGAEATKDMQARFGRAKNVGEESVGAQDPGATSVALMFQGFHHGVSADPG